MYTFLKSKIFSHSVCFLIGLVLGFFIGRSEIKPNVHVEYKPGKTVYDTIYSEKLVPYKVVIPSEPVLPLIPDTIKLPSGIEYITLKVDTNKIIANYVKENTYKMQLFNDEHGKLIVDAKVQYNELKNMSYAFTPIEKEITTMKIQTFTPFISAGYNTLNYANIGCGIFYHNLGLEYNYNMNMQTRSYHQLEIKYKF